MHPMREPKLNPAKDPTPPSSRRRAFDGWESMKRGGSGGWLIATFLQALLTWGFVGLSKLSEGRPWESQAKALVLVAIVATWSMALRTIHARLLELIRLRRSTALELLKKASESNLQAWPSALKSWQETYVRQSIFRLRVIAAGITIPFFVMPIFSAAVCLVLFWLERRQDLLNLAALTGICSVIVAAYFRWSIVVLPALVQAHPSTRPPMSRMRRGRER